MDNSSKLKILICTGIFPPEVGGPATYSKTLAEELVRRGHGVKVITYSSLPIYRPINGQATRYQVISISRSRHKPWHYLKYFFAVLWYGLRTDILYAQDPVSSGFPTFIASRILRKPFLVKVTGDYSWEQAVNRGYTNLLIDNFQYARNLPEDIKNIREAQIRTCKGAAKVIAPAEYLASLVRGWGVEPSKVQVVYNAAPKVADLDRDASRAELGIGEKEFLIISAGRNVPWKGFPRVKQVVEALQEQDPTVRLEILHDVSHDLLMKWLAAADVFVLNTAYEGAPHIILEAMQFGIPVVTTNVCGNPEFVEHEITGFLVEYNDQEQIKNAILKLYRDKTLRKELAHNAKEAVKKYSLQTMVTETEKALTTYLVDN